MKLKYRLIVEGEVKKEKTIKLSLILSIIISLAIIILILYFTIDAETIDQLSKKDIKYEYFLIAVLLNVTYWFVWGARLKVIANRLDKKLNINWWNSTKIIIANMFLASITPSMAGGEPVRIYLLNKRGMNLGSATAAVISERLVDAIIVFTMVPLAFFVFYNMPKAHVDPNFSIISKALPIGIFIFALFFIIFLYAIAKPEKTKRFLIWINKKISRFRKNKESEHTIITRIKTEVDNFHKGIILFKKEGRVTLIKSIIITVFIWSTGFMVPSMILMGLGFPPYFIESYAAQALLLVIVMMPTTPGSSGLAELGAWGLYGIILTKEEFMYIGIFVILFRFVTYHMNLIAGAIFQYKELKSIASFSLDKIKKEQKEGACDLKK